MRPKNLILLLVVLLLPSGAWGRGGYVISPKNAEYVLTAEDLRYAVSFLTDSLSAGRGTGTAGSQKVIGWLGANFSSCGLQKVGESWFDGFRAPSGRVGHNVVGAYPGTGSGWVVVMAHFDHIGMLKGAMYPGADANASGVASLLSLAKMLRRMEEVGRRYGKSVLFVALDGKEQGMSGAEALWKRLEYGMFKDPRDGSSIFPKDVALVVNIDQVGSTFSPLHPGRSDYLMMLSDPADGRRGALESANKLSGLGLDLAYDYYGSRDFTNLFYRRISDQKVFLDHGVPAVMFTSGITFHNNKPSDTASTLDYTMLRRRIILMFHYLSRIL